MAEDRELVERLAAIDATPRVGWVAGLRADLDAAWETGELPVRTAAPRQRLPRRRSFRWWPSSTGLVATISVAAITALIVALVVVPRYRSDIEAPAVDSTPTPGTTTPPTPATSLPATTVPTQTSPTVAPVVVPPATAAAACEPDPSGVAAANAPTQVLPTGLWRVIPESAACLHQGGPVDSVLLEQRDLESGEVLAAHRVTVAEIHEIDGGYAAPWLVKYPARYFDGLDLAGIVGRQVILKTMRAVVGVDIDTGAIASVPLDDPERVVGVVGSTILAVNAASVARADLQTGTLETLTTPGVDIVDATVSPEGMWFCSTEPSRIVRVDAEGKVHQLDQFAGTVTMCYLKPVPGSLWAVVTPVDGQQPGGLQRLDPNDGHVIATAEQREVPPGNFIAFADTDGYLALLGDWVPGYGGLGMQVVANWWWIDNEGRITELAPPEGVTVLGMANGQIVGYGPDYQITSYAVADLMPST